MPRLHLVIKPLFKSRRVRLNPCISQMTDIWWLRSRDKNGSFPKELGSGFFCWFGVINEMFVVSRERDMGVMCIWQRVSTTAL
jgi:hypothetical protein